MKPRWRSKGDPFTMKIRSTKMFSIFMVVLLLLTMLPSQGFLSAAPYSGGSTTASAARETPLPPPAQSAGVAASSQSQDNQQPGLTLDVAVTPTALIVGDVFTITVHVDNHSAYAANDLAVSLPLPPGAVAYPTAQPNGWTWQQPVLGPGSRASFQAALRLEVMPPGEALLARPQATARGMTVPAVDAGGAVVLPSSLDAATVQFTPGTNATLRTPDGRVEVLIPADASNQPFTLQHSYSPAAPMQSPSGLIGFKRGFPTFYLNAVDPQGQEVHQFAKPLVLRLKYTSEQLQALGFTREDTALFWFDESQPGGGWVALPTTNDTATQTLTALIDHLSPFAAGEEFKPSDKYIPNLKSWQVGLFQGNVTFQLPIDVPEGPGGTKPELYLGYDSATTDGPAGLRAKEQAGWVGPGWTLHTGYVATRKLQLGEANDPGHFSIVLDGKTYDLMRAEPITSTPGVLNPTDYIWRTTDESFIKIYVEQNGVSTPQRGGYKQGQPQPRYRWIALTKDGTRYEFEEDAWWGWAACDVEPPYAGMETYKWLLSKIVDSHGNVINYKHERKSQQVQESSACLGVSGTVDYSVWPSEITWGGNANTGTPDRFKVQFVSVDRNIDLEAERSPAQLGPEIRETRQLEDILVLSNRSQPYQATSWELIRRYDLMFESGSDPSKYVLSDASTCAGGDTNCTPNSSTRKLTLKAVQLYGNDNSSNLPPVSFTYQLTRGTDLYAQGGWNRLRRADNNQGGVITFDYENIGSTMRGQPYAKHYKNNNRVVTKTIENGMGNSYVWRYSYKDPAYNSLGTILTNNDSGPNTYPNSAQVYYSEKQNPGNIEHNRALLVHKANTEFRGHSSVVVTEPSGSVSEHYFVQGNVGTQGNHGCYPKAGDGKPLEGEAILNDTACFVPMRDREFLKGRELRTIRHQGAVTSPKLLEVEHQFGVKFYEYGDSLNERLTGLWRAFTFESQTKETAWEGGATPLSKTTQYGYDVDGPAPYGNLLSTKEYFDGGVLLRETLYTYKVLNDAGKYIVDRKREESIKDGQGRWLARTVFGYDGSLGGDEPLTKGDLTLVRKYHDLPLQTQLPGTIHSADQSFTFDIYGNQVTEKTYEGYGEATILGSTAQFGPAGNNSAPKTTTTEYDPIFHTYEVRATEPNGLFQQQHFDLRMGLVTRYINYKGVPTDFTYDAFGRNKTQVEAGDSAAYPTVFIEYYDRERPVKYLIGEREVSGTNAYRPSMTYYDGLGREIQTKIETLNCQESTVVDKVYDGLDQIVKQSQPRYVNIGSQNCGATSPFWQYTPPGSQLYKPTITDFDALGRKVRLQEPDPTIVTTMQYGIIGARRVMTTTDPDRHQERHDSDMYGRLLAVQEYSGTGTLQDPYLPYATTSYAYTPLDLLSKVTNALGKTVDQAVYDSLGRKIDMFDQTTGRWRYTYNPSGTLKTQTDARGQTLTVTYDALDRTTHRNYSDGSREVFFYDQGTYGKGERTAMERYAPSNGPLETRTAWQYDERGRKVAEEHSVVGLPGTRIFRWAYDSANREVTITYPAVGIKPGQAITEQVRVEYDDAWRPVRLCSNEQQYSGICYSNNAGYTALDQPTSWTLGNGLVQRYQYTDPMQRLQRIQVGTTTNPGAIFNRTYTYQPGGNIASITSYRPDTTVEQTQLFGYDHLDRLVRWRIPDGKHYIDERYYFDKVGNIDLKEKWRSQTDNESYDYIYNYQHQLGEGGPYAVRDVQVVRGGSRQSNPQMYDANGNLVSSYGPRNTGQRRTYTWNAENQPARIETRGGGNGVTETYIYSADGDREKITRVNRTTYYLGGLWEEEYQGAQNGAATIRVLYTFRDQVVAQRTIHPNKSTTGGGQANSTAGADPNRDVVYLHADHLGSISVVTDYKGAQGQPQRQEFDPWGLVRNPPGPPINSTSLNYTGRHLDETGLLYYIARYYDPELSRFVSPDSIVPGIADGKGGSAASVGMAQNHNLTVDFHESEFANEIKEEHTQIREKGFWFQRSEDERRDEKDSWGPLNPQTLNRYAYTLNNPVRYNDPTGHLAFLAAIPVVLGAVEVGLTVADAYNTAQTLADKNVSREEKAQTTSLFVAGLASPGAGASFAPKVARKLDTAKHHVYPQRKILKEKFDALGIDIHKYTVKMPRELHVDLHRDGPFGGKWNQEWVTFFDKYKKHRQRLPTVSEVKSFRRHLMDKYNINKYPKVDYRQR